MAVSSHFVDSNVALYLLSADPVKAQRAEQVLATDGVVSVQVLNEVAAVCRRKLGFAWAEIEDLLGSLRALCRVVPLDLRTHERGIALARARQLSVYDGMIVAAALEAGCVTLYTEDLQHGQLFERRLRIVNPFVN
jgi:predicted nucleic acid-binding protein